MSFTVSFVAQWVSDPSSGLNFIFSAIKKIILAITRYLRYYRKL
ncbi:hypothetical protein AB07_4272 [Citrobacter freundii]|uniref:Uncharacterized protein n=1 Tax=Citrobacter freundii TaxID=546 RepID=A0A7G2IN06_CITFR|nr:hypothetical protein AB07_4272 [Citrobacter freundii]CDL37721.1 hypothetical protein [Citrobacter freundii]